MPLSQNLDPNDFVLHLAGDAKNFVYPVDLFRSRLQEEMWRSLRDETSFLYIKIRTRYFGLLDSISIPEMAMLAWKIAVMSIMERRQFTDATGYLDDETGLGILFVGAGMEDLESIRKEILRNLTTAGLTGELSHRTSQPLFEAFIQTSTASEDRHKVERKMAAFNKSSAGLIRVERFAYTSIRGKHRFYPVYRFFKRSIDLVCSFCGIVVLSPLLLLCALCVKLLGGPGPIIFAQERVGLDGRHFKMFKFRSMRNDAEALKEKLLAQNEATGPVFKMENDPRIYPFGRILRKYSLDELPQLFNILKNDMSIVGPRPPVPKEVATYEPWQRMRLSVKPGLVCHWQVRKHDTIDFKEWVRSDNQYVHHGDLKTDIELIAKTFRIVFGGGNK